MTENAAVYLKKDSLVSQVFLILNNAIPLIGAVVLEWNLFVIILIYWCESAVIGFYNICRMIKIKGNKAVLLILFFCVHYGLFMVVHYIAILLFGIFSGNYFDVDEGLLSPLFTEPTVLIALGMMMISHGISFFMNFIRNREYEGKTLENQMIAPYPRIVIMQVVILGTALFLAFFRLDEPLVAIILLVLIKSIVDFFAHRKAHKQK
ncbi:MAG: hypothetical protein JXB88_01750 [Spirochaetales bacterium]|nr:hypothetical protein [Spirochaetales bacterium]